MAKNNETPREFTSTIVYSSKEMSKLEQIMAKNTEGACSIGAELANIGDTMEIKLDYFYVINVHNEHSKDNKDYSVFVCVDTDGNRYASGSDSLMTAVKDIISDIEDGIADGNIPADYKPMIKFMAKESKNRPGKVYLTAVLNG